MFNRQDRLPYRKSLCAAALSGLILLTGCASTVAGTAAPIVGFSGTTSDSSTSQSSTDQTSSDQTSTDGTSTDGTSTDDSTSSQTTAPSTDDPAPTTSDDNGGLSGGTATTESSETSTSSSESSESSTEDPTSDDSTSADSSADAGTPIAVDTKPVLIKTSQGQAQVTVLSASRHSDGAPGTYSSPPRNGSYLVVKVSYVGKADVFHYNPLDWRILDASGKSVDNTVTYGSGWDDDGDSRLDFGDLKPGQKVSGVVTFDVKPGAVILGMANSYMDDPIVWKLPA